MTISGVIDARGPCTKTGQTAGVAGPGGFAVILNEKPAVLGSEDGETTNIRMEGKAIIAAIKHAAGEPCIIYTDSQFWVNVITVWSPTWEKNGWKNSKKQPVANQDLWQPLIEATAQRKVTFNWVKGHSGVQLNEVADRLGLAPTIAYVNGDDILGRLDELVAAGIDLAHFDTGEPIGAPTVFVNASRCGTDVETTHDPFDVGTLGESHEGARTGARPGGRR